MNTRSIVPALCLLALIPFALAEPATPSTPETKTRFTRLVTLANGDSMLETAAVTYRNAEGVRVTLIGAVHIAEADYFAGLDASFDEYDALLYEMVKPKVREGESVRTARRQGSLVWIGGLQRVLRDQLGLEFQLEAIEYENRPNFVHADLDSESFLRMQDERREGFMRIFLRAMAAENRRQRSGERSAASELTPFHILAALKAPDRQRQLKLLLARQLHDMETQIEIFDGPDGSVILTERNRVAMNVLRDQIAEGKTNLGVFYGAAHLPGMEKILVEEMGFTRVGQTWRTAWDMSAVESPTTRPAR